MASSPAQKWVYSTDDVASGVIGRDAKTLGGKGARLAWLADRGFDVPPTWFLPARAFVTAVRALPTGHELRSLLRAESTRSLYLRASEARDALAEAAWPLGLEEELRATYRALAVDAPWGLAVRSSATSEDGQLTSMAGLSVSRLAVGDEDVFLEAVREVWCSLYDPSALEYLRSRFVRDAAMAVVFQPTVRARASGVLLVPEHADSQNPGFLVNASLGLGTSVVSGMATPDLFRIDEEGRVLERSIAPDRIATRFEKGKLIDEPVLDTGDALSAADLEKVAQLGRRLRIAGSGGWDAEFTFEEERLVLVQARPLTARRLSLQKNAVYTNANLGEALPGVATPMTWSVAGAFAEEGFKRAFGVLGCKITKGTELVVDVYGRFYLNLSSFSEILGQIPWIDVETLVELGGGGELPSALDPTPPKPRRASARTLARMPFVLRGLIEEQRLLDDKVAAFEEEISERVRAHRAMDLTILPDEGLGRRLREIERLLARTGKIMLTCAAASMAMHLCLRALFSRDDDPDGKRGSLAVTAGIRDLESARPALGLLGLAHALERDREAFKLFESYAGAPGALIDALPEGPFKKALGQFLEAHGDRAVREAELATPRWREDPSTLFAMLRATLRGDPEAATRALNDRNETAVRELEKELASLPFARRQLAALLVPRAQRATRYRERLRAWVLVVLGMMREVVLDADRRIGRLVPELADERARWAGKPGGDIPDAFFLTQSELIDALDRARTNLLPFFRTRRGDYARNALRPEPESTFRGAPSPLQAPPRGERLLGVGASPGIVSGVARVIRSAEKLDELRPGEILVTHATDIGWTPIFPQVAAVVTELGGALSHAAIVAREFGIPTVVSARTATLSVRTGDRLRVDGDRGIVEVLERAGT